MSRKRNDLKGRDLEDLLEGDQRYRLLFEMSPMAIYRCDCQGVILEYNRRAEELWGRAPTPGETGQRYCGAFKLIRPDGSVLPHCQAPIAEVLAGKIDGVRDAEVTIERPDGSRVPVIVNIRPLTDKKGEVMGAINCFYDVSARQQAETQRHLLLREMNHRIKNILAIVLGIAQQTARASASLQGFIMTFGARIASLAQAHDLLIANHAGSASLYDIIAGELTLCQPTNGESAGKRFMLAGEDVQLEHREAVAVALAVHELATNAVKYGAFSVPEGKVQVHWQVERPEGRPVLALEWKEVNGPPVDEPRTRGFGSTLMERALGNQMQAETWLEFRPEGVCFRLKAPLSPVDGLGG